MIKKYDLPIKFMILGIMLGIFGTEKVILATIDSSNKDEPINSITVKIDKEDLLDQSGLLTKKDYKQIVCLAKNMYFEARNQPDEGIEAVGFVTLNRVESGLFPNTICGVVYDAKYHADTKGNKPIRYGCQFTWYCDDIEDKIVDVETWNHVYGIAYNLYLNYKTMDDVTKGATYYHTTSAHPKWDKVSVKTAKIEDHVFYKPKGQI